MVQELQQSEAVPEEFYNLSQLAEMSAIAKKLSTTDVIQIKNYINKGDLQSKNEPSAYYQDQQMLPISYDPCDYERLYYEPTKKKWRNDWENCRKIGEPLANDPGLDTKFAKFYLHDKRDFIISQSQEAISDKSISDSSNSYLLLSSSASSNSCSDDDSSKSVVSNYSHKIFDRKKQRTFKHSTDEEQSSNSGGDALNRRLQVNFCDENLMEIKNKITGGNGMDFGDYDIHGPNDLTFSPNGQDKAGAEDIHICPECGKKYSTSSNLARHRQTHRSLQDKKARRCQHCDKVYVSMPAFSMHQKTHQSGCQCPHCGKCFSRAWLLQGHLRTHTGEKPFQCTSCKKSFADKSNLRAHIQTHSNTKPFACSRCGKSFALKSYLYKHEESSCLKNHLKVESKKGRRTKQKKSENSFETQPLEPTHEMSLKSQHSLYVKEKIKEILEDGKKTYITLKNHKDNAMKSHVENRISVIKSLSSASLESNVTNEYENSVLKVEPESPDYFRPVGITGSFTVVV